ncbi:MAG TPA: MFS transporter [Burkholderiales bacterium]|nr:MFS transporter [Burkholderiales bacterium]
MTNDLPAAGPRPIRLPELFSLVLLWNSGYKGARVLNTLYALHLGAQPLEIGLLLATYGLFALVLGIYAGRVVDRYGVRLPVIGGVALTIVGIIVPYVWPSMAAIFASAAITGVGFICVQVGVQTLTASLASGGARTRNINLYSLVVSTADFVGPVVAGFAIDHAGYVQAYLVLAILSSTALPILAKVAKRFPAGVADSTAKAGRNTMDLVRVADLRRILISSAVVMTGNDLFQLYMPLYGHAIGLSASAIGLVLGAFAVAGFVTRAIMPLVVRRFGEEQTLSWSIACTAVTFLLIPLVHSAFALGAISFALGVGMAVGQPLSVVLAYNYSPPGRGGESIGLRVAINNSMHIVVPTVFGGLGSIIGIGSVFWFSSALLGLGAYVARKRKSQA